MLTLKIFDTTDDRVMFDVRNEETGEARIVILDKLVVLKRVFRGKGWREFLEIANEDEA